MKKILLVVLAMVLFNSVAFAEGIMPPKFPSPLEYRYVWKVYVENSFPFGTMERNLKTRIALKVIATNEVELGQGFVTVVLRTGRDSVRLLIPNDSVLYIIQSNYFPGWELHNGTE